MEGKYSSNIAYPWNKNLSEQTSSEDDTRFKGTTAFPLGVLYAAILYW